MCVRSGESLSLMEKGVPCEVTPFLARLFAQDSVQKSQFPIPLRDMSTPPTRQLYARFHGQAKPRDKRDVEEFFRGFSGFSVKLLVNRDAAFINFQSLSEAKRALRAVANTRIGRILCDLRFNKPSNSVCIPFVPNGISNEEAKEIVTQAFSKFGALESPVVIQNQQRRGRCVLVNFRDEKSAVEAVRQLQEHQVPQKSWKWDLEFYQVIEYKKKTKQTGKN